MRKVHGVGINDCKGWCNPKNNGGRANLNYRIYMVWAGMITRCYSSVSQEKHPTYVGCTVCERWHKLSNFAKDITKIQGYKFWEENPFSQICLDKDVLIEGNKEYRPEACSFISKQDSALEVCKRCADKIYTEKTLAARIAGCAKKIICTFSDGREEAFDSTMDAERKYGFNHSIIAQVCLGRRKSHHGCSFRYA